MTMVINKLMFAKRIQEISECSIRDAKFIIDMVSDIMIDELSKENSVMMGKVGTFCIRHKKERRGRNPQTQEIMTHPKKAYIKLRVSSLLKQVLKDKFSK